MLAKIFNETYRYSKIREKEILTNVVKEPPPIR